MVDLAKNTAWPAFRLNWLTGPIFDKELRVASRRRRYYWLRFAYVCLLTFVILQLWYATVRVPGGTSAVVQVSRLGTAGKTIIVTIIWFQFITGQILATVLLSDAISSEIRQRTLDALLVTPIGAAHIVLGKLLSRLLQLGLLLAISLPLLAVVRVFGGVPWDFVISGLCITLTASIFAGSLSLFSSVTHRYAYSGVLVVLLWYLVVWGLLAFLLFVLSRLGYIGSTTMAMVMPLTNPVVALLMRTQAMLHGSSAASIVPLPFHCLTILVIAGVFLVFATRRVRRITLASILARTAKSARAPDVQSPVLSQGQTGDAIRRVQGRPIVWKELCTPFFLARRQVLGHLALWIGVAGFILVAVIFFGPRMYGSFFIPILILHWLFIIRLAIAAAGAITREKEARTWAVLLTTPLEDGEIVKGKAWAALRRNAPLLIPLVVLYGLAVLLGPTYDFEPLALLLLVGVSLASTVFFLLGLGLYLSTRLKTTGGAVAATLGVYLVPKFFCCGFPGPLLLLSTGGFRGGPFAGMLAFALVPPAIHAAIGLLCLRAATRRLRRNVF